MFHKHRKGVYSGFRGYWEVLGGVGKVNGEVWYKKVQLKVIIFKFESFYNPSILEVN
jgi:hypothetical protein